MTRLCRHPGGQVIARLLRQHAPTWLSQMPSVLDPSEQMRLHRQTAGTTQERMLRELAEAVEVMAQGDVLVLWLEDLHWSDPSTVDWLAYMARRLGPARVLILGSYRPCEALTRGHPIEDLKGELKVRGRCREITLSGLDASAVGEYLAHRLPGHEGMSELAGLLHQRTEGNPLRAEAAAAIAREGGFVQLQAWAGITGGWALAQAGDIAEGLARARDGVAAIHDLGSEDFKTYFLGLLADILARDAQVDAALEVIAEALVAVERTGERFYAAELHRQRPGATAPCFETALGIARQQGAWALERRALLGASV